MLFQTIKGVQWRQTCSGNKIGQIQVKSDFRGTELAMGRTFLSIQDICRVENSFRAYCLWNYK